MTTTEQYSGYAEGGKSSSRVLRPPGGGSSNIFGDPEEIRAPVRKTDQGAGDKQQTVNEPTPSQKAPQQQQQYTAPVQQRNRRPAYNPITGEEYPAPDQKSPPDQSEETKDNVDKTTEENASTTDQQPTQPTQPPSQNNNNQSPPSANPTFRPSSKVSQPPGGASTRPW